MPLKTEDLVDGSLTVSFHGKARAGFARESIKETSVLVMLSIVGNPHCKGPSLALTVEHAINHHRTTSFLIGDEVYWHNLNTELSITDEHRTELKRQAIALGDVYLEENLPYVIRAIKKKHSEFNERLLIGKSISEQILIIHSETQRLGTPIHIIRWNEWVRHEQFLTHQAEIRALYDTEQTLIAGHEASTADFVKRHCQGKNETELQLLDMQSRGYLKEESPAIIWIASARAFDFIAYPGKTLFIHEATRAFFITNAERGASNHLRIQREHPETLAGWLEVKIKSRKVKCKTIEDATIGVPAAPLHPRRSNSTVRFFKEDEGKTSPTLTAELMTHESSGPEQTNEETIAAIITYLKATTQGMKSAGVRQLAIQLVVLSGALLERPLTPTSPRGGAGMY